MKTIKLGELVQSDYFYFLWDTKKQIRRVNQRGRTSSYCPKIGEDTIGHSKGGGECVYLHSADVVPVDSIGRLIPIDFIEVINAPACACTDRPSFDYPEADETESFDPG
jgi:hypothetical protein